MREPRHMAGNQRILLKDGSTKPGVVGKEATVEEMLTEMAWVATLAEELVTVQGRTSGCLLLSSLVDFESKEQKNKSKETNTDAPAPSGQNPKCAGPDPSACSTRSAPRLSPDSLAHLHLSPPRSFAPPLPAPNALPPLLLTPHLKHQPSRKSALPASPD